MYKDFEGRVVIDSKDYLTTIDAYASSLGVKIDGFEILGIEISLVDSFSMNYFICKSEANGEIIKMKFQPRETVFKDFSKVTSIFINSDKSIDISELVLDKQIKEL